MLVDKPLWAPATIHPTSSFRLAHGMETAHNCLLAIGTPIQSIDAATERDAYSCPSLTKVFASPLNPVKEGDVALEVQRMDCRHRRIPVRFYPGYADFSVLGGCERFDAVDLDAVAIPP